MRTVFLIVTSFFLYSFGVSALPLPEDDPWQVCKNQCSDSGAECLTPGKPFIYNGNISKEWQMKATEQKVEQYEVQMNIHAECILQCAVDCLSGELERMAGEQIRTIRKDLEEQKRILKQRRYKDTSFD